MHRWRVTFFESSGKVVHSCVVTADDCSYAMPRGMDDLKAKGNRSGSGPDPYYAALQVISRVEVARMA